MNEAAKAHVASRLAELSGGEVVDFDYGTSVGRKAAEAAIREFLFDNPGSVVERPGITSS